MATNNIQCPGCNMHFRSQRGLNQHLSHANYTRCLDKYVKLNQAKKEAKKHGGEATSSRVSIPEDVHLRNPASYFPSFGAERGVKRKAPPVKDGIELPPWKLGQTDEPQLRSGTPKMDGPGWSKIARIFGKEKEALILGTKTTGLDPPKASTEALDPDLEPTAYQADNDNEDILHMEDPDDDDVQVHQETEESVPNSEGVAAEEEVPVPVFNTGQYPVGNVDVTMLESFHAYCEEGHQNFLATITNSQRRGIELMDILRRKKAPLDTYDDIMLWHFVNSGDISRGGKLRETDKYISRKVLIKQLATRYNLTTKAPKPKKVILPVTKAKFEIVCHDAKDCIESLLTDPRLTDDDFWFFDNDPTAPPPDLDGIPSTIGDVNTGNAYREAVKKYKKNKNDVVLPIIMYIDGAETGAMKNMPITALKMTLGIFKRNYRDKDHAWRPLGYVPGVSFIQSRANKVAADSGHVDAEDVVVVDGEGDMDEDALKAVGEGAGKSSDLHAILDTILESYRDIQRTGLKWDLRYRGKTWKGLRLIPFLLLIKSDTKEADTLCGSYTSYSGNVQNLCRYCICPTNDSDNPQANYPWKTVTMLKKLVHEENKEMLKKISQHLLQNAFHKIQFSPQDNRGVHGACPLEILHAVLLGIFMYLRDTFYDQLKPTSLLAKEFDAASRLIAKQFARQSERSMPNCQFSEGIRQGKLNAKEYVGVLLVMASLLHSTYGKKLVKKNKEFTELRIREWAHLCELLLVWHAFMCEPEMKTEFVTKFAYRTKYIMWLIKKRARRDKGMGLRLMKFHALTHLEKDIMSFGVPMNVDTGSDEKGHKPTKSGARLTQKNAETFIKQTALRLWEFLLIELAMEELKGSKMWTYFEKPETLPPPVLVEEVEEPSRISESKINIMLDRNGNPAYSIGTGRESREPEKGKWGADVLVFLNDLQKKMQKWETDGLEVRSDYKLGDQIYRGHPNYRQSGPWRDWVMADWGDGGSPLPARIWCFVKFSNLPRSEHKRSKHQNRLTHGGCILKRGEYAVVEKAHYQPWQPFGQNTCPQLIFKTVTLEMQDNKRKFYLLDTSAFREPCFIIPDHESDNKRDYHQIANRNTWPEIFTKWTDVPYPEEYLYDKEGNNL